MTAAPHLRVVDDPIERAAIQAEDGLATDEQLRALDAHADSYQPQPVDDRGYLPVVTTLIRRFLGMEHDEPTELTFFYQGRIHVAQVADGEHHEQLLAEGQRRRDFTAAYMLVNGPINPAIFARYDQNEIVRAWNGRVGDADITRRRALFIDVDPVRPKGISATDGEKCEAYDVSAALEEWLAGIVGQRAIGHGDSGNGYFTLVALDPQPVDPDDVPRISEFLRLLNRRFGTERVKVDESVFNAARLMPAPGTWKRKGRDAHDRPHRTTSFCCRPTIERVPLTEIV